MQIQPRVAFKTIGCRLNQAETAELMARFEAAGYRVVLFGEECDACVVHGCAVTMNAERDTRRAAQRAARLPGHPVIAIAGCTAETAGPALRRDFSDFLVVGQAGKFDLPDLLHAANPDRFPPMAAMVPAGGFTPRFETTRATIKVQDGCNFGCAYCIVPKTRSKVYSRPPPEILAEIGRVAAAGYREIVLTGANLGCYRHGEYGLPDLVRDVTLISGVDRIRLSSIEISTAEREIIDLMAISSKLCHFLHLPMQSGSDRILRAMGRRYTVHQYREVVEYAGRRVPHIGIGADIIVGFPGEDDEAFEETYRLAADLPLSNLHVFPYSRRPSTRADTLPDQVPAAIKKERVKRLLELEAEQRRAFAESFLGHPVSVLVERLDSEGHGRGWTGEYLEARITGPDLQVNQIVTFTPASVKDLVLHGAISA